MKYFLVAGEASGDMHAAALIQSLKSKQPQAEIAFWGGDYMQRAYPTGFRKHYNTYSVMGFVEVLFQLRNIFKSMRDCKNDILTFKPDVVILVDFPGFNLRIAEFCKQQHIKVVYYIAPKVWAWKESRAKKLERFVDLLLLILPFEKNYFSKFNITTEFVGNPSYERIATFEFDNHFRSKNNLDERPIIALLPGSRKQELAHMLPLMVQLKNELSNYQFVIAGAGNLSAEHYIRFVPSDTKIVFNDMYNLLSNSVAAVVCSGTATLETALLSVPQVCGYKGNALSYAIAKRLVKVNYISLVNLCLNKPVIAELIQNDWNMHNLKQQLLPLLEESETKQTMLRDYARLKELMGERYASDKSADCIINLAQSV